MRTINRNVIPTPTKLSRLHADPQELQNELNLISNDNKKAKGHIYGDQSVKNALVSIYKNVCFLCQSDISSGYDIEHFLPWSKYHPERAYDWNNLHQSCKACNNRKKKKIYKELDQNEKSKVNDILLLDPSSDNVESLITFDPDTCDAISLNADNKSNLTAIFLNEADCIGLRKDHWIRLNKLLISNEWLEVYFLIKKDYSDYSNTVLDFTKVIDAKVGAFCYRISVGYLSINKEYNIFTSRIFYENTGIDIELIKKYSSEHCSHHNIPLPQMV